MLLQQDGRCPDIHVVIEQALLATVQLSPFPVLLAIRTAVQCGD